MPELPGRTTSQPDPTHTRRVGRSRRFIVVLCTAAVTSIGGITSAQVGFADPDLTLEEVKEKVDELHHEAEVAAERYHMATDELDDIELRLAKAEENVARQEARLKELTTEIGDFAAATYRSGGIDPTMQMLLADDPDKYLAQAAVIDAYTRQQGEQLQQVAVQRQRLEQDTLLYDEELARLEAVQDQLAEEKAVAEELLAEAQRLLDSLKAEERERLEAERREAEEAALAAREQAAEQESRSTEREQSSEPPPASGKGQVALDFALAQLGDPYVWGGTGPDGWDCSGLTQAAWAAAGVSLPRSSYQQIGVGTRVSWDNLRPGDLLFFYSPISHVGIYAGNGQMVHAVKPGTPVSMVSLDGYYRSNFSGATRPGG
ncbi:MAG TPA: NlpC/P60 family protein [Jiangellaceae bacterium]|nr:NlpC/P60 family protein [Jiangellaceae bacterium]